MLCCLVATLETLLGILRSIYKLKVHSVLSINSQPTGLVSYSLGFDESIQLVLLVWSIHLHRDFSAYPYRHGSRTLNQDTCPGS